MNNQNEIKKSLLEKKGNSLSPQSQDFNFELWAQKVRQQMMAALQEKSSVSQGKTFN